VTPWPKKLFVKIIHGSIFRVIGTSHVKVQLEYEQNIFGTPKMNI
jgi:hypothetical protein